MTTKTQLDYDNFKAQTLQSKNVRMDIPLVTLKIVSEKEILVDGKSLRITQGAFLNILKVLGLTEKFLTNFQKATNDKARANLINIMQTAACADTKKQMITLVLNQETKHITAVLLANAVSLSTDLFFKVFEDVYNNNPSMEIKNMSQRGGNIEISVINSNWEFQVDNLKDEMFHSGLTFIQTPNETVVCPFNERLVCSNGMVVASKGTAIVLKNQPGSDLNGFISTIRALKGVKFFEEEFKKRAIKLINTRASYAEMNYVYKSITAEVDMLDPWVKQKVHQFVDIDYVFHNYMNHKFDVLRCEADMQKKIPTHMSGWELVNALTDLSSHANQYGIRFKYEGDSSIFKLQKVAGELVMKDPLDLEFESKIPKINFHEIDTTKSTLIIE